MRIDSRSWFANPYINQEDGSRDEVCDLYEETYLPNKKSILNRLKKLKGKVLICQCFPKRCHGESLLRMLNDDLAKEKFKSEEFENIPKDQMIKPESL